MIARIAELRATLQALADPPGIIASVAARRCVRELRGVAGDADELAIEGALALVQRWRAFASGTSPSLAPVFRQSADTLELAAVAALQGSMDP